MGVGHAAVALGFSRAAPRLNVGLMIFAAFLADFLLGIFAAFGLERAHVPTDFASRHYLTFTFPYSHGLVPLMIWGVLLGAILCRQDRRDQWRVFFVIAALVVSHFVLDGLVHVPELPLLGQNSPKVGLGLWNHMPLELGLETLMTVGGLAVYFRVARESRLSRWGLSTFMFLLAALTWTQLWSSTPPPVAALVPGWIVMPLLFSAIPFFLDRKRVAAEAASEGT